MLFMYKGRKYFRFSVGGRPIWQTGVVDDPKYHVPEELAAELEATYQADFERRLNSGFMGAARKAIVESLQNEEERRGHPILAGHDDEEPFGPDNFGLEPPDAYHETGAAGLG